MTKLKRRFFLLFTLTVLVFVAEINSASCRETPSIKGWDNNTGRNKNQQIKYEGPIIIKKGGIYKGNWESLDSNTPAVKIATDELVIIENSNIRSAGRCIEATTEGGNFIIRNNHGYGLVPTIPKRARGRFLYASGFYNAVVENNYLEHTTGIYFLDYKGNQTEKNTIKVRFNKAKNIDGRDMNNEDAKGDFQFVQLDKVTDVPGIQIAWNLVQNEFKESLVEDNINIFLSSGTPESPILIHDNFIDGAYPLDETKTGYAGGGIMCDAAWDSTTLKTTSYVLAFNNHIIRTVNYGLGIAGGNNNNYFNNRVLSSNLTPDGKPLKGAGNNGIQVWNYNHPKRGKAPTTVFYNNSVCNNTVGYMANLGTARRKDFWFGRDGDCINCSSTQVMELVNKQAEDKEYLLWEKKVKEQNIVIGPISSSNSVATKP